MIYHLESDRLKRLGGKWPHRKKKPVLTGIRLLKSTSSQTIIYLVTKKGAVLVTVMCIAGFSVGPTDTFLSLPVILRRSWWPLQAKASEQVDMQLIIAMSRTKK